MAAVIRSIRILSAASLLLVGCSGGLAGPDEPVVAGQFGSATVDATLLATHAGVELERACNGYFASEEPLRLDANDAFRVRGRFRGRPFVIPSETGATLYGSISLANGAVAVTVTLVLDGSGPAGDSFHATLVRDERFTGVPSPCPL